jgi:hypothetical protein
VRNKSPGHSLPPLPKRLTLKKAENTVGALLSLLREIALSNRTEQPQTFYSLREVAQNFTLSVSIVSRSFLLLEDEGLLGRIRGSRTVLHGRKYDRKLHVRGVVGIPVSIFRFSALADYRALILQLRRQLRRRGFMPAAVFFERNEIRNGSLTSNLLQAKVDTILWFSPDRECQATVAAVRDAGVRVIGVNDNVLPSIPCRYEIRRDPALRAILRQWRASGLTSTVVVTEPRGHSAVEEERCRVMSEDELLPAETLTIGEGQLKRVLTALFRRENRGILLTGSAAAFCAVREPEAFHDLLRKCRVALVDGPISMLFARAPVVTVDLITVDWKTLASCIVSDLITQAAWRKSGSLLFEAQAQMNVPLQKFCHEI